jgi:peptide/nickel transport system substrate-binding protein
MKRRDFLLALGGARFGWSAATQAGAELRFCLRGEPRTLHPLLVADESSETVRYLTAGVLIRFNRASQQPEPELASYWKTSRDGRTIQFELRTGLSYSDGTPFTADDVAFTLRALMDPELHSPVGDSFRSSSGPVQVQVAGLHRVIVTFPVPVAGLERLFDQVAILSARSPQKERAVLGPFRLEEHKPGSHLLLVRNPHYWKRDASGRPLPYLDSIRLEIQQNRELEIVRFRRGQLEVERAYQSAMERGLWKGHYAATNSREYWAEGAQTWFWSNYEYRDGERRVQSPEELREYDAELYGLLGRVFADHHIPADVYHGKNLPQQGSSGAELVAGPRN